MSGIIGRKLGMTQIFLEDGTICPVTVVEAGLCTVIQVKTQEKDGYEAIQLGFDPIPENKLNRPQRGHCRKAGEGFFRIIKEFRVDNAANYQPGQQIRLEIFQVGDRVKVTGISKGRGFAGVVKRHGFHGGPATHGSMFHRAPGSIGASAYPSRVFKGQKMPGHMGNQRVTVSGVQVMEIREDQGVLVLKGAIPGSKNSIVAIHQIKFSAQADEQA
ncbi:MAG: 50S ribosomal protein L3 [Deltaproteobacteria bacterium]|nr:50S ribosomal protein L3 [Deltaproteobacteria bacterium]MBW2309339.1 50S ribosomal protein L3 [Deltaproteobacteria bacterium]